MPTVENLTPNTVWTTLYGIFAICLLFLILYRVYDAIHTIIVRRRQEKEAHMPDFAEKVSQKVIEKLEPRFEEIEKNLKKDKERLDNHEHLISDYQATQKNLHDGMVAICKFMLVLSNYGEFGNSEEIKKAKAELTNYLAEQM